METHDEHERIKHLTNMRPVRVSIIILPDKQKVDNSGISV